MRCPVVEILLDAKDRAKYDKWLGRTDAGNTKEMGTTPSRLAPATVGYSVHTLVRGDANSGQTSGWRPVLDLIKSLPMKLSVCSISTSFQCLLLNCPSYQSYQTVARFNRYARRDSPHRKLAVHIHDAGGHPRRPVRVLEAIVFESLRSVLARDSLLCNPTTTARTPLLLVLPQGYPPTVTPRRSYGN